MGVQVAEVITGLPPGATHATARTRGPYLAARLAAFVAELERRGCWFADALRASPALLAICCLETGCGAHEHNFNVANLRWFERLQGPPPGYFVNVHTSAGVTLPFRAYATLGDGVRDFVGNMSTARYGPHLARLLRTGDAASWYHAITAAGYTTPTAELWASYASVLRWIGGPLRPGTLALADAGGW